MTKRPIFMVGTWAFGLISLVAQTAPHSISADQIAQYSQVAIGNDDKLVLKLLPYASNIPEIMQGISSHMGDMQLNIDDLLPSQATTFHYVDYTQDQDLLPPDARKFKDKIAEAFAEPMIESLPLNGFNQDLNFLAHHETQRLLFGSQKAIDNFLFVAPFLYQPDGSPQAHGSLAEATSSVLAKLDQLSPLELIALYTRPSALQPYARTPLARLYETFDGSKMAQSYESALLRRLSKFQLTLTSRDLPFYFYSTKPHPNQPGSRTAIRPSLLSLQLVSPLEALYRGVWGGDCASECLAYFALHKNVKVFKLNSSTNLASTTRLHGYVFVLETMHQGKMVPYILTMNSAHALERHALLVVDIIARAYQTDQVFLPNFRTNERLSDNPDVIRAFDKFKGPETLAEIPAAWDDLEIKTSHLRNHYRAEDIQHARLVEVVGAEAIDPELKVVKFETVMAPAHPSGEPLSLPPFARAIMANQHRRAAGLSPEMAAQLYSINAADFEAIALLLDQKMTSAVGIQSAVRSLGMKADFLKHLPISRQLEIFSILAQENPPTILAQKEWLKAATVSLALSERRANEGDVSTVAKITTCIDLIKMTTK